MPVFYSTIVSLIQYELDQEVRNSIKNILTRAGSVFNMSSVIN